MHRIIRSAGAKANFFVGPLVMLIGFGAAITAVVLSIALETPGFLILLLPGAMGIGAGLFLLRMARRARLEIDERGITWCGFAGREHSLRWDQLHRIWAPPPGANPRLVALAQLRDGAVVEIRAIWASPTSPVALLGASNHEEEFQALVQAHQHWLTATR